MHQDGCCGAERAPHGKCHHEMVVQARRADHARLCGRLFKDCSPPVLGTIVLKYQFVCHFPEIEVWWSNGPKVGACASAARHGTVGLTVLADRVCLCMKMLHDQLHGGGFRESLVTVNGGKKVHYVADGPRSVCR